MIYDVIYSLLILIEKLAFISKQLWGFIISLTLFLSILLFIQIFSSILLWLLFNTEKNLSKVVNYFRKIFILDFWLGSEYPYVSITRNAPTKHWVFPEKTHILKMRNFWNEITENFFFSISNGLHFLFLWKYERPSLFLVDKSMT